MALSPGKVALVAGGAFVLGGLAGAGVYAFASRDVEQQSRAQLFGLPDAAGPRALGGIGADDVDTALGNRGFSCADAGPADGEDGRTFHRCVLRRADGKAEFTVSLAGSSAELVTVTTTVVFQGLPEVRVVPTWADIATSFRYAGATPARARRWLLAAYENGGALAIGDAYLRTLQVPDGLQLEIRARGDLPPPATEPTILELARRFAPVLRLSDAPANPEPYEPMAIPAFVDTSRLTTFRRARSRSPAGLTTDRRPINEERLRSPPSCPRQASSCYLALDVGDWEQGVNLGPQNAQGYAALQIRLNPAPTVYWHAVRDERGGMTVQYWFLYLFNDFSANRHESDWEHVSVYLDVNRAPLAVFYSSHEGGTARHWASLVDGLNRAGDRLVVYVARGSHANYFESGTHDVRVCRAGFCGHGLDVVATELRELRPRTYDLVGLTGPPFTVGFGTGNFLIGGRVQVDDRPFPDPRRRLEFRLPRREFERAAEPQ